MVLQKTAAPWRLHDAAVLERFGAPRTRNDVGGVLVFAAHPDDETIGAGAQLLQLRDVTIVFVTDGAPRRARPAGFATRADYARQRRAERDAALACAGVPPACVHELGIVDQEASHELVALTTMVLAVLRAVRPAVVLTHPYEGGHPDHDATAFAVQAALRLLANASAPVPAALEMTSYHAGPDGIRAGRFVPGTSSHAPIELALDAATAARKRAMLDRYVSQREILSYFHCDYERFRVSPRADFRRAPHDGRLFYEYFDWGTTGPAWRRAAADALCTRGLPEREPCR